MEAKSGVYEQTGIKNCGTPKSDIKYKALKHLTEDRNEIHCLVLEIDLETLNLRTQMMKNV